CNEPIHSPSSPNRDHLSRHPDRRAFPSKLSRHSTRRPQAFRMVFVSAKRSRKNRGRLRTEPMLSSGRSYA
ncbi:hypothetical protein CN221_36790, partial [Sinorhizobium meliloti]